MKVLDELPLNKGELKLDLGKAIDVAKTKASLSTTRL